MNLPSAVPSINDSAVSDFLGQIQGIINRLAGQSAACKNWIVGLATAALLFVLEKEAKIPLWTLCPLVALLGFIDAYYLSLERDFINVSRRFVKKLHQNTAQWTDVYTIPPPPKGPARVAATIKACASFSVWPFYGAIIVLVMALDGGELKKASAEQKGEPPAGQVSGMVTGTTGTIK